MPRSGAATLFGRILYTPPSRHRKRPRLWPAALVWAIPWAAAVPSKGRAEVLVLGPRPSQSAGGKTGAISAQIMGSRSLISNVVHPGGSENGTQSSQGTMGPRTKSSTGDTKIALQRPSHIAETQAFEPWQVLRAAPLQTWRQRRF